MLRSRFASFQQRKDTLWLLRLGKQERSFEQVDGDAFSVLLVRCPIVRGLRTSQCDFAFDD